MNEVPKTPTESPPSQVVNTTNPSSTSNKKYLVIVLILLIITTGVIVLYFLTQKSKSSLPSEIKPTAFLSPTPTAPVLTPTIPMKEEYQNPFDEKTQYQNPFEKSENPFDALSQ